MKAISIIFFSVICFSNLHGQDSMREPLSERLIDEFEFLSLCRCQEYLTLRNYDFIKWKSEVSKQKQLQQDEYSQFLRYNTLRLSGQFYKEKYTGSTFLKKGISAYFGSILDFKRLDSLYFEPMVQYYVELQNKSEIVPYLGLGDVNFMMDCFYRVKEIPLEMELQLFLLANKQD